MTNPSLFEDERAIEIDSIDQGIARYRSERHSAAVPGQPEQELMEAAFDGLVQGIETLQKDILSGRGKKGLADWGYHFVSIPSDRLAFVILCAMFNNPSGCQMNVSSAAFSIANAAANELHLLMMKEQRPDVVKHALKFRKKKGPAFVKRLKKHLDFNLFEWDKRGKAMFGMQCINILIRNTALFEWTIVWSKGKKQGVIRLLPEVLDWISKRNEDLEVLHPFFLPMVVPPLPWEGLWKGGYYYHAIPLVKDCRLDGEWEEVLDEDIRTSPTYIRAINKAQACPYRIDRYVHAIASTIWKAGGGWAGLPPVDSLPLPPKPADIDTNPEAKSKWKLDAMLVYDENARLMSKRKAAAQILSIANRFSRYDKIYFPLQVDWRGRQYAVPTHLNPQGNQLAKGLIRWAEKKPLGATGFKSLLIHVANCYGHDKISFHKRVKWVESGMLSLLDQANDPFEHREWADTDDPFVTLAAITELRDIVGPKPDIHGRSYSDYESDLIIHIDGTCNGLQHFSAMGRDPVGAKAVNLIDAEDPEYAYQYVADEMNKIVEADCEVQPSDHPCHNWKGHITAKTGKRSTMTTPYGVTVQGIRNQFLSDGHCDGLEGEAWKNADYLTGVAYEAIGKIVVAARTLMDWLQEVAKQTAEMNVPLTWGTPSGFRVRQDYLVERRMRVYSPLTSIQIRMPHQVWKISKHQQMRGLPPNVVHSYDAAHLCMVQDRFIQDDRCMAAIHDSFGTHACDVKSLALCTRAMFYLMHGDPLLVDFKRQVEEYVNTTLPDLPPLGDLDIKCVLGARYLFH